MAGAPLELIAVEVRADLAQLQQQMPAATRIVDQNVEKITQSVEASERAIVRSTSSAADGFRNTGTASRVFGQQLSQVGQQVAAGTSALQALAIQLPDIALGMSATGAKAGSLAAFFGGPWGIALTTAAAVAVSLTSKLWDNADASDGAAKAAARLAQAWENLGTLKFTGENATDILRQVADLRTKAAQLQASVHGSEQYIRNSAPGREAARLRAEADAKLQRLRTESNPATNPALRISRANQARLDAPAPERAHRGRSDAERASEKAAREAERERERQEREAAALEARYSKTLDQLTLERQLAELRDRGTDAALKEADILEANYQIESQFPELAESTAMGDQLRLQLLKQIAAATIEEAYGRKASQDAMEAWFDAAEKRQEELSREREKAERELANKQEQQIRTLASLYHDAFTGGTKAIWDDFKQIGLAIISEVLARFTVAQLAGGASGGGGFGAVLGEAIASVLPGFASGGSMRIGGRGGTDRNVLALNGRPIARVSSGETLHVTNPNLSRGGAGNTVISSPQFDLRGAVVTEDILVQMDRISKANAAEAGASAYKQSLKDAPRALQQARRYGSR